VDGLQIESIRGFHVGDLLQQAFRGPTHFERGQFEIHRMRRSALRMAPRSTLQQRVRIEAGDQLRFAYGLHSLT